MIKKRLADNARALVVCFLLFLWYVVLISKTPAVYWADAHIRLALRDRVLIGYWPPLIQAVIFTASKISGSLVFLRVILTLIAAGALFCFHQLAARLFSESCWVPVLALVLLGVNMMYAALATVPYTEVLFVGFAFLTLIFVQRSHNRISFYLAVISLGLACLTRYEGWILGVVLVTEEAIAAMRSGTFYQLLLMAQRSILLMLAPTLWILFVVIEPGGLWGRLNGLFNFAATFSGANPVSQFTARFNSKYITAFATNFHHMLAWQAGNGILIFGVAGIILAVKSSANRASHLRIIGFLILDLILIAFWSPWDFTNLRQVFIWEVFLILYAAYGIEQFLKFAHTKLSVLSHQVDDWFQSTKALSVIVLFIVVVYVPATINFISMSARESKFLIPAQSGAWLASHVTSKDAILVLSDDSTFQNYALAAYVSAPLRSILDDRFDQQYIDSQIAVSNQTYVVPLYESMRGLSAAETDLLTRLEDGNIPATGYSVAGRSIWVLSSKDLINYFNSERSE